MINAGQIYKYRAFGVLILIIAVDHAKGTYSSMTMNENGFHFVNDDAISGFEGNVRNGSFVLQD